MRRQPFLAHATGAVSRRVDDSGTVLERYDYRPFGEVLVLDADFSDDADGVSDLANPYTFTGREFDPETGLFCFRNRYYHAELGRFIHRDPIGYVDGMNLYAGYFVPGGIDPRGLATIPVATGPVPGGGGMPVGLPTGPPPAPAPQPIDLGDGAPPSLPPLPLPGPVIPPGIPGLTDVGMPPEAPGGLPLGYPPSNAPLPLDVSLSHPPQLSNDVYTHELNLGDPGSTSAEVHNFLGGAGFAPGAGIAPDLAVPARIAVAFFAEL